MTRRIHIGMSFFLLAVLGTACQDPNADILPGLYVENESLGTFGGDTPLLEGTVSGYTELDRIDFTVPAWGYAHTIDLSSQGPKVFNYSFRMEVPENATFPQTMTVKVTDRSGKQIERTVALDFLPDTVAPWPEATVNDAVEVVYEGTQGVWKADYSFADDRSLGSIRLRIPVLGVDDTAEGAGKTGRLSGTYVFPEIGNYPATLTAVDATGNLYEKALTLVVMPKEDEDGIDDYPQMYLFDADEDEASYLSGYYHYMYRDAACCYKGQFYASHDDFHLLFAPKAAQDGDLFGASPYIPSKLMNKNGYVVPVTIEKKGYYGIYIDLMNHSFTLWDYDIPAAYEGAPYTGTLQASGTGFSVGDWNMSGNMTRVEGHDYVFTVQMETVAYSAARDYYFTDSATWDPIFRCDNKGEAWFVGASGPCCQFTTDYVGKVDLFLDTALPWGWIKYAE